MAPSPTYPTTTRLEPAADDREIAAGTEPGSSLRRVPAIDSTSPRGLVHLRASPRCLRRSEGSPRVMPAIGIGAPDSFRTKSPVDVLEHRKQGDVIDAASPATIDGRTTCEIRLRGRADVDRLVKVASDKPIFRPIATTSSVSRRPAASITLLTNLSALPVIHAFLAGKDCSRRSSIAG